MTSKIEEARYTCSGLGRLVRKLNGAAVDIDNGGQSAHELLALLASTNDCINNLTAQLEAMDNDVLGNNTNTTSNVSPLRTEPLQITEPFFENVKAVGRR